MALILKKTLQGYFWLFEEKADPRVGDFFLMSSPFPALGIALLYLYLINDFLPKYMKNREPYNLDMIIRIFNFVQVVLNGFITFIAFREWLNLNWFCAEIDFSDTPRNRFHLRIVYLYFLTKLADLLDTIFFILRGKQNQVTFLHVYHHFGMIVLSWTGVKFLGGGHSYFLGGANGFVHTVMYFYYLLTIWKPEYKKSLWWKKYITQLQLIQFIFFLFIYGQLLFNSECGYPKFPVCIVVPQSIIMIIMFSDFYRKAYMKPKKTQ